MNKALIGVVTLLIIAGVALNIYYSAPGEERVLASTTTSLYATGLLDYLVDSYNSMTGSRAKIEFIPVGSGEALKRAEAGEVCMVFVHAPPLEKEYINRGIIEYHRIFAYNYFVIVGPPGDPANVSNAQTAVEAMKRIYAAGEEGRAVFVSRGDNSGTHVKEMSLWEMAGLGPRGRPWYKETGSGMAETLKVASELEAYTLSDIGTFLKVKPANLVVLYENSSELINIYSVYIVSSCDGEPREEASGFIDWLTSSEGQNLIASYGVEEYGRSLFYPAQGVLEELWELWTVLAGG